MRSLKAWRRRGVSGASAAIRAGAKIPEEMTRIVQVRTVPAMIQQTQRLLSLLAADRVQELTRGSALPVMVSSFYALKAQLYLGLKIINDAGHELYAHDPLSSSRFNLSLLHGRYVSGTAEGQPTPPAPAPPAANS